LNTEVTGRSILALIKGKRKLKKELPFLNLEVLVEAHPTPNMLAQISKISPLLKEVRVDWFQFYTPHSLSREDWILSLSKFPKLSTLITSDIDHKTDNLITVLPLIGINLTRIHLQELWSFKYSMFRSIKQICKNLEKLVVFMTTKVVVGTMDQMFLENDVDLAMENSVSDTNKGLGKLKELHLMGPFGFQITKFLLSGAVQLLSLTLAIEWPDPAFCNVRPTSSKDLLGKEYMDELLQSNNLSLLEEIHLLAQYVRGRKHLTKDFALYVVKTFPLLKHFGTTRLWNMTTGERREFRSYLTSTNRNIVIDPDSEPRPSENIGDFRNIFMPARSGNVCSWLPVKKVSTFSFFEEMVDMIADPALLWQGGFEDSDEDENSDDENEMGEINDVMMGADDDVGEQENLQLGLGFCPVM